jgi:hypothetical protein
MIDQISSSIAINALSMNDIDIGRRLYIDLLNINLCDMKYRSC